PADALLRADQGRGRATRTVAEGDAMPVQGHCALLQRARGQSAVRERGVDLRRAVRRARGARRARRVRREAVAGLHGALMRALFAVVVLVAITGAAVYFGSPYWTAYQMQQA